MKGTLIKWLLASVFIISALTGCYVGYDDHDDWRYRGRYYGGDRDGWRHHDRWDRDRDGWRR